MQVVRPPYRLLYDSLVYSFFLLVKIHLGIHANTKVLTCTLLHCEPKVYLVNSVSPSGRFLKYLYPWPALSPAYRR